MSCQNRQWQISESSDEIKSFEKNVFALFYSWSILWHHWVILFRVVLYFMVKSDNWLLYMVISALKCFHMLVYIYINPLIVILSTCRAVIPSWKISSTFLNLSEPSLMLCTYVCNSQGGLQFSEPDLFRCLLSRKIAAPSMCPVCFYK